MDITQNQILFAVIALLVLYLLFGRRSEGMCNATHGAQTSVYNPRQFQPEIAEETHNGRFIELNDQVETPYVANSESGALYGEVDALQPVDMSLSYSHCSPSCCSQGWPTPFSMPEDDYIRRNKDNIVASPYTCSNGFGNSGCLCMTRQQQKFLSARGNNSFSGL